MTTPFFIIFSVFGGAALGALIAAGLQQKEEDALSLYEKGVFKELVKKYYTPFGWEIPHSKKLEKKLDEIDEAFKLLGVEPYHQHENTGYKKIK